MSSAELVQLQTRVIALENIVIAWLARANDADLTLVRDMAADIAPRAGFTRPSLTRVAAGEMLSLVRRSRHFAATERAGEPPPAAS